MPFTPSYTGANPRSDFHTRREFENPDIFAVNREPAHSRWGCYDSEQAARERGPSPYALCLNGKYQFRLYDSPAEVDDFYRCDYDASSFSDIAVPGNWEVQGFGEPIYTNVVYPWPDAPGDPSRIDAGQGGESLPNPPYIPLRNPTGCYRHIFTVPDEFAGREVFLRFDGVETAFYLWINGIPVGYSQDSKLPCEFHVTKHLKAGENLMALQVMRFADSSYLEDQDYWYLSGIHRSVWMLAKPAQHIVDYRVTAVPDLTRDSGLLTADITLSRQPRFAACSVVVAVYDANGELLAKGTASVEAAAEYRDDRKPTANTARISLQLDRIQLWSTERPLLYTVTFSLLSPEGQELDFESCRTGFKKLEVKNGVVHLNGRRLVVRGVNRHEHAWLTGRAVTVEHMTEEIRQMKRMNINAMRTCHYPDSPDWYDLCDQHGILVVCECNIETHGVAGALTQNPAWAPAFVERAARMVQFHKNHVCIFSWSLGNESGTGPNHAAMYGFIKEYDPTRLCQYEAGDPGPAISDVRGKMYATVEQCIDMLTDPLDTRPIILVEYLYQISNSGGGMERFVTLTRRFERFQGGFIWDWQDKCLPGKTASGAPFFAYGGDFGESFVESRDGGDCPPFMTCNGIVLSDLRWKPVAYDVKAAYAPVRIEQPCSNSTGVSAYDPGDRYVVYNDCWDETLDAYRCEAVLRKNGIVIHSAEVVLPELGPGQSAAMEYAMPHEKRPGCEYTVEFVIRRRESCFYAEADYEVACYQFVLESGPVVFTPPAPLSSLQMTAGDAAYHISGENFEAAIDRKTGELNALRRNERDYLMAGGIPCLCRPITGLDVKPGWGFYEQYDRLRDLERRIGEPSVLQGPDRVRLDFPFLLEKQGSPGISGSVSYVVTCNVVEVECMFNIASTYRVPRVGLEFILPAGFEELEYYGYGETENYSDRLLSARLGVFESTVSAQHFPFVPPSEYGGHEATRWLSLRAADGRELRVTGDSPFHFDARHASIEDYRAAAHDHELPRRAETWLHIDAAHGPIGSNMAWSTGMPKEYELRGGCYRTKFRIEFQ